MKGGVGKRQWGRPGRGRRSRMEKRNPLFFFFFIYLFLFKAVL